MWKITFWPFRSTNERKKMYGIGHRWTNVCCSRWTRKLIGLGVDCRMFCWWFFVGRATLKLYVRNNNNKAYLSLVHSLDHPDAHFIPIISYIRRFHHKARIERAQNKNWEKAPLNWTQLRNTIVHSFAPVPFQRDGFSTSIVAIYVFAIFLLHETTQRRFANFRCATIPRISTHFWLEPDECEHFRLFRLLVSLFVIIRKHKQSICAALSITAFRKVWFSWLFVCSLCLRIAPSIYLIQYLGTLLTPSIFMPCNFLFVSLCLQSNGLKLILPGP